MYFPHSDGLVALLIDKDNRVEKKPVITTDEAYWVQRPIADEVTDGCNEFWHGLAYVAKG